MDCTSVSNYLIDYIEQKLDNETNKLITEHLSSCYQCKTEFNQTKELFNHIENTPEIEPGNELRIAFDKILKQEKVNYKNAGINIKSSFINKYKIAWQIAAALLLLFSGYLIGYNSNKSTVNDETIANMQKDVSQMKEMLNLLKDESASQRIKAVNYTEEIQKPNSEIINALINTLNTDKNSNVRLAAIYSLSRFKDNNQVRKALINTLNTQDDPMVQIVIINLLVEMEEIKAVDEFKKLLQKKDLQKEVKEQAEIGIKVLS